MHIIGSKTSTTEEFLKAVNPKIALIGVGENNTFGHPNDTVLERLTKIRCKNISNRSGWRNKHRGKQKRKNFEFKKTKWKLKKIL